MRDVSQWERLPDALERVLAATGLSITAAETNICRAISDGAIKVRGMLSRHLTNPMRHPNTVLEGPAFRDLADLKPEDLDWVASRPKRAWIVRREFFRPPGPWELEWVELFRSDVTNALCMAEAASGSPQISQHGGAKSRSRPARERIERALKQLYPNGVPEQADESNKILSKRVGEWLKNNRLPDAKIDTILRAAGRRK